MSEAFSEMFGQTAEPEAIVAEEVAAEPAQERLRAPDGKFAKVEGESAPPVVEAVAEPTVQTVPISAMLDERDKRKAEQARAEAAERQLAEWRARADPAPPSTVDPEVQQALYAQNLRASRRFAEREYGKEQIATIHDWAAARCDTDPAFNQQMFGSEDPYEVAYQAYNREQLLAEVKTDDFAEFKAWQAAKASGGSVAPSPPKAPPPVSLVNAPNAGGRPSVLTGEGRAYENMFKQG